MCKVKMPTIKKPMIDYIREIELAKCGLLRLVWYASPFESNRFEVYLNTEIIYMGDSINDAMEAYNRILER